MASAPRAVETVSTTYAPPLGGTDSSIAQRIVRVEREFARLVKDQQDRHDELYSMRRLEQQKIDLLTDVLVKQQQETAELKDVVDAQQRRIIGLKKIVFDGRQDIEKFKRTITVMQYEIIGIHRALDSMKEQVAKLADMMSRQLLTPPRVLSATATPYQPSPSKSSSS